MCSKERTTGVPEDVSAIVWESVLCATVWGFSREGRPLCCICCHSSLHPLWTGIGVIAFINLHSQLKRKMKKSRRRRREWPNATGKQERHSWKREIKEPSTALCARVIVVLPLTGRTAHHFSCSCAVYRSLSCKAWEKPPARKNFSASRWKARLYEPDFKNNTSQRPRRSRNKHTDGDFLSRRRKKKSVHARRWKKQRELRKEKWSKKAVCQHSCQERGSGWVACGWKEKLEFCQRPLEQKLELYNLEVSGVNYRLECFLSRVPGTYGRKEWKNPNKTTI